MNKMDKVGWSQQPQPNPPNFGQARMVPRFSLDLSVALRRPRCRKIIANHEEKIFYMHRCMHYKNFVLILGQLNILKR